MRPGGPRMSAPQDDEPAPEPERQVVLVGPIHQADQDVWRFAFYVGEPGNGEPGSEWVAASGEFLLGGLREALLRTFRAVYGQVVEHTDAEALLLAIETLWPDTARKVARIRREMGWQAPQEGSA
jgi:hypothetical protein